MDRKIALARALEEEYDRLPPYSALGDDNKLEEYGPTITYLREGEKPYDWEENDLLVCAVEDFETMCSDYGV